MSRTSLKIGWRTAGLEPAPRAPTEHRVPSGRPPITQLPECRAGFGGTQAGFERIILEAWGMSAGSALEAVAAVE
jgi:hypothetical protein